MVLMYGGSSKIFVLLLLMTLLMRFWKRNDTIWKLRTSKLVRKTLTEKKQVLKLWAALMNLIYTLLNIAIFRVNHVRFPKKYSGEK